MLKETGRGNGASLRRTLDRRLSTPWPAVILGTPGLFRGDGLPAKVLLTLCAAAPRENASAAAKAERVLDAIAGEPQEPRSPTGLRVSHAQLAALLVDSEAQVEAVRRVQRAVRLLEESDLLAARATPGSSNELVVLSELSGQLSTNLWRLDWIQEFTGSALWIYLYIHRGIHREGGRIGRTTAPRAGSHYMTAARDLLRDSAASTPTVMSGLRALHDLGLTREVRRGRDTYVSLVDPDLWTQPGFA